MSAFFEKCRFQAEEGGKRDGDSLEADLARGNKSRNEKTELATAKIKAQTYVPVASIVHPPNTGATTEPKP